MFEDREHFELNGSIISKSHCGDWALNQHNSINSWKYSADFNNDTF